MVYLAADDLRQPHDAADDQRQPHDPLALEPNQAGGG